MNSYAARTPFCFTLYNSRVGTKTR